MKRAKPKPAWASRRLELESAENHFEAASSYFQKTVTQMRDAAREVSRAATRLTNARKALRRPSQERKSRT